MSKKDLQVYRWLLLGVFLIVVQALLGGITRLSGSGLSITEWDVITGTLPPLNATDWQDAFNAYKKSPQFQYLNFDFQLDDFKFIYFWEWFHRLWARMIGLLFAIPFIYFLVKGYFKKEWVLPLIVLFLLGALQGAVGWIMVQSGLTGDATYVKPTRLAIHFVLAMILGAYVYWLALSLKYQKAFTFKVSRISLFATLLLVLIFFQFVFGALLAGHKAANIASTWPTINGSWIPDSLLSDANGHPFINNKITIHFIHRTTAYLIAIGIFVFSVIVYKRKALNLKLKKLMVAPIVIVIIQIVLGVSVLFASNTIIPNQWRMFDSLALVHQMVGMLLMLSWTGVLYFTFRKSNV